MVYFSLPPVALELTVEPIWTWVCEWFSSMMTAFLMSADSAWMRPSTKACSFLASSYSAFSVMSPCSLASWMRVRDLRAPHVDELVELRLELLQTFS